MNDFITAVKTGDWSGWPDFDEALEYVIKAIIGMIKAIAHYEDTLTKSENGPFEN